MNILMISDVYFPRVNGVSTSIQIFRQQLRRFGHRVVLIAPDYGVPTHDEQDIVRIPSRRVWGDPEDRMMKAGTVLRRFTEWQSHQFDVIHIQTPFIAHYLGVQLSRRLQIPRVETYHTFFEAYLTHYIPFLPNGLLQYAARVLSRWQCNALDGVIVPSQAMADVLRCYGVTTFTRIIPTGMTTELLRDGDGMAFRQQYGIAPHRPTLVYVGRLAFEKNIDFLLHVLRMLKREQPDILLIIAGEGPARRYLQRLVTQLQLTDQVLFVGYLKREENLADCYKAGDVFVFASRTETQGLVVLEAMSLGVPVVSLAVMGLRDLLNAQQGAVIAEETVADFADKVKQLLRDARLRQQLGMQGQRYAKQWDAGKLTQQLVAFYQEVSGLNTTTMV